MKTSGNKLKVVCRIKEGASIFQDHHFDKWPGCKPPAKEYEGDPYQRQAKNPAMLFEARWNGRYWECKADGYGHLRSNKDPGDYGNGSILVHGFSNVDIIEVLSGELPNEP